MSDNGFTPRVEDGHIGDLRPDQHNPRRHSPRNIAMIEKSLSETGAGRSVVTDKNGNIIVGNGTVDAAANTGFEEAIFVHSSGDRLLVHVRDDLDIGDPQSNRMSLYDNRSAELASWDTDILAAMADTEMVSSLFTEEELRRIMSTPPPGGEGPPDDEERPELGEVVYRVVIQFKTEDEQMEFIAEMDGRGIPAKPLIV